MTPAGPGQRQACQQAGQRPPVAPFEVAFDDAVARASATQRALTAGSILLEEARQPDLAAGHLRRASENGRQAVPVGFGDELGETGGGASQRTGRVRLPDPGRPARGCACLSPCLWMPAAMAEGKAI